jgi:hypothetical protein
MPSLKTCLLISDDPDDHFEFSEALLEASTDTVLVSVFDSRKVVELLKTRRVIPDYVFLDLSMSEHNQHQIHALLHSDGQFNEIKFISYGSAQGKNSISSSLSKDYSYTDLKEFVKRALSADTDHRAGNSDHKG